MKTKRQRVAIKAPGTDGGRDHTEDSGSQIILLELGREGLAGTGSIRASGIRFLLYMEMSECI